MDNHERVGVILIGISAFILSITGISLNEEVQKLKVRVEQLEKLEEVKDEK